MTHVTKSHGNIRGVSRRDMCETDPMQKLNGVNEIAW